MQGSYLLSVDICQPLLKVYQVRSLTNVTEK